MAPQRAYLDHNASAPLLPEARAAMLAALDNCANPSSVHAEGREVRRRIEAARRDVAALAGGKPEHVVFTSGATEAASTLLSPRWRMGRAPLAVSKVYVCSTDHPCVHGGGRFSPEAVVEIPVDREGIVDLAALRTALAEHDRAEGLPMVAIHAANNETGVVQPMAEIGCIGKAAGAIVVFDAVQAAGRIPLDISAGWADFLILSSHKIGGPKGVGAIVGASDLMMPEPLIGGGGQERGHRGGTENPAAIAGFGAAARVARDKLGSVGDLTEKRGRVEAAIRAVAPDAVFHGEGAERLANTVFFSVPGLKAETAQIAFDLAGVALSAGSACSSGKVGPSRVLKAMGESAEGGLRVSIGHSTSDADLDAFAAALADIVSRARRRSAA